MLSGAIVGATRETLDLPRVGSIPTSSIFGFSTAVGRRTTRKERNAPAMK